MSTVRPALRLVPAVALLVACGGADLMLPGDGEPSAIQVLQGDAQSGRVGLPLAQPVVAGVTDPQERPVDGARVALVFTGDGSGATVAPDTATTDADGYATFQIVLGSRVGPGTAEVRVAIAGGQRVLAAPLRFDAVSADANLLAAVAGDGQSAPAGAMLPDPLVVQVTDAFGNPIAGVPIAWSADAGSVSSGTTATGSDGLASVDRTLGAEAGVQHATASAPGLAGSPVTFTHTASPGAASALERVSGDGQSARVGTSVADPLVVRAKDAAGNPVAGLAVAWVVGTGGGTLTPPTSTTGPDGLASTRWTLGPNPGPNSATAVISGVGTVGFTATADPGTPVGPSATASAVSVADATLALGQRTDVTVTVRDASGAALEGVSVTLAATGTGNLIEPASVGTARTGTAKFRFSSSEAGTKTLTAVAGGVTLVQQPAVTVAQATTTTRITSDDPDPSPMGVPFTVRFTVTSDAGTPAGAVTVTLSGGGTCTAAAAVGFCDLTPAAGGSQTLTAAYAGSGSFAGSSDTEAHSVAMPSLTVTKQPSGTATSGVPFHDQPELELRTSDGKRLEREGVRVTASLASGTGSLTGAAVVLTDGDGRVKFDNLGISGAPGVYTIRFSADGFAPATSHSVQLR